MSKSYLNIKCDEKHYYGKGKPDGYNKKQATFTRSLQTLTARELVWSLGSFEQPISIYGKNFAIKMRLKPQTIDEYKAEGMQSYREHYTREKEKNPSIGTFEEWFTKPMQPSFKGVAFGGMTTRANNYIKDYGILFARNIKYVRLTPEGIEKAKKLLKVK